MKQNNSTHSVCPCCERHCPADNLHCRRGEIYFGKVTDTDKHADRGHGHNMPDIKDETVFLMLKCGHYLHHGLDKKSEDVLSFLSDDEKTELTKLLKKCIEQWNDNGR